MFLCAVCLTLATPSASAQKSSSPPPTTPEAHEQLATQFFEQRDYSKALAWYRKAAAQGNPAAENDIGWLYQNGWGAEQDYAAAAIWYRKAAEQGNAVAECNLGWLYRNGRGVEADYGEAMSWFRKAADQGPEPIMPVCSEKTRQSCVSPPQPIYQPAPEYSKQAREAKYQGTCVIALVVEPDGSPSHVSIISGLDMGLDEKAVEAVKTWKFNPAMKDGNPVRVAIAVEVDFHLY
jgi:TonB family protein